MSKIKRYISDEEVEVLGRNNIRFSKCYPLVNDSALLEKEVNICAITEVEGDKIKNRIVFKKGKTESSIDCLRTSVCQFVASPESESGFKLVSSKDVPKPKIELKPEEHYVALKSVVENLVESGIQNKLMKSFRTEAETGKEPVDMNRLFRQQLSKALVKVAPEETKDLSLFLLDYISADDPTRFETFSKDFRDVICNYFDSKDIEKLNGINGGILALDSNIQGCILKKPNLPPYMIKQLSNSEYTDIRRIISEREDLPLDVIKKLAQDVDYAVRVNIARSGYLPEDLVRKLADDEESFVRMNIAERKGLPEDLVRKFADDENTFVRGNIAEREDLPDDIIRKLANDKNIFVKETIAKRKYLPEDIIRKLAYDKDKFVRMNIAKRKDLTEDLIRNFSQDKEPYVRSLIASRNDVPIEILEKLIKDEDAGVREAAIKTLEKKK